MTLEDIYKMVMFKIPPPPDIGPEVDKVMEFLKNIKTPTIGELPTAPQWIQDYARSRGIHYDQQEPPQQP